ncbi:ectoine hydroxylase [Nitrosopumilus maritimus]|uniref:Ectoine dioxygenase n=1 Tax=Nitrosopumilus maritimus (strain SCM1) TaxID=436308 RepID=A9A2K0_NITMS|nr:ectoine hydroxylase [Nitrosopumilus maritimus]ABX13239.1 ectoine hydroxylase [Nitrosopumilus maritimus SCM1]AER00259.1 ectoine hydroxylase [synthetic construct]
MYQNNTEMDFYPTRMNSESKIIPRTDPVVYPSSLTSLTRKQEDFFEKNGYLVFENLFSIDEVTALLDELKALSKDDSKKELPQFILEETKKDVRSIFEIHKLSEIFSRLCKDSRLVDVAQQLLGSKVYVHQSRVNLKPGFDGKEFYWHSDFETWHSEDGMPNMRAVSCSVSLTKNYEFNGPLMVIPGSHKEFVSCSGTTPDKHYKQSLKRQEIGTPDKKILEDMVEKGGIVSAKGDAGSAIFFDCNIMHGSNGNISPYPRSNAFIVFNSIHNKLITPFCGLEPRPNYIGSREFSVLDPIENFLN